MVECASNGLFASIVVPVYNGAATIRACLDALLHLEYPEDMYEVIVVDNNSNDGTPEIVSEYPVQLVYEHDIQTSYAARNAGIRRCQGEVIAFTDADCIADARWLAKLVQPFCEAAVAGVRGRIASYGSTSLVEEFTSRVDPLRVEYLGHYLSMVTANVAYRAEVLRLLGGFRSRLYTGADVDFGFRVQQLPNRKVVYIPEAVVHHMHRTTLRGLCRQYSRYGFSEIVLDTIYRGERTYPRTPKRQLWVMLKQCKALGVYVASMLYRLFRAIVVGWDTVYATYPILMFAIESANLLGKLRGIASTRWFRRERLVLS